MLPQGQDSSCFAENQSSHRRANKIPALVSLLVIPAPAGIQCLFSSLVIDSIHRPRNAIDQVPSSVDHALSSIDQALNSIDQAQSSFDQAQSSFDQALELNRLSREHHQ